MSEPKASLLPANSSPLEKALDLGFGTLLERVAPPFPALMNPLYTPSEFLPYLAADRGVSDWDAEASEAEQRLTVALSWQIQRQAGTPKALSLAVESLGFTPNISAWYQQRPLGVYSGFISAGNGGVTRSSNVPKPRSRAFSSGELLAGSKLALGSLIACAPPPRRPCNTGPGTRY